MRSVACFGGLHFDIKARVSGTVRRGTSNPVVATRALGGVACNVARWLARLGCSVKLVSLVGDDGAVLRELAAADGIDVSQVESIGGQPSASYTAVLDSSGALELGIAEMGIYDRMDAAWVDRNAIDADLWFVDANISEEGLTRLAESRGSRRLFVDPVSVEKAPRVLPTLPGAAVVFPDAAEARELTGLADEASAAQRLVTMGVEHAVVTLGPEGVLHADATGVTRVPATRPRVVLDVTGAGDALAAGYLAAVVRNEPDPIRWGLAAASLAVETVETVPANLTLEMLRDRL